MKSFFCLSVFLTLGLLAASASATPTSRIITLKNGWLIQSSARVRASGNLLSSESFRPHAWYKAVVPSTILGNLVDAGVFRNPFRGTNLSTIPDSLFNKPWWYRTEFKLARKTNIADHVTLRFLGIIYRADIWFNGKIISGRDSVVGAFRQYEFNVTKEARFGGTNVLAVEVWKPGPGALTLGFVDWSPEPPDRDMGLWRPVEICLSGAVSVEYPFVASKVDTATLKGAELTVSAELMNNSNHLISGVMEGKIAYCKGRNVNQSDSVAFSKQVSLLPHERKTVAFTPQDFRQLIIVNPHLWWTDDFGKPSLYSLRLEFLAGGVVTDSRNVEFGIRQINTYINSDGFRGFKLNGRKILIRGGGWVDNIFLNQNERNLRAQIQYAVNMHLNAIRMEGFWGENSDIYRLCDEKGILIMAGWSCQWEWDLYFGEAADKFGGIKSPEDMEIAARSFKDQIKWLRNHPSIFVWGYGSDKLPRPELERKYQKILSEYDTTRPFLASDKEHVSALTGPTAVKMRGPYNYVPPVYWFADTLHGGAFGFNTETGPGPEVPREGSLKSMFSPDSLWPINGEWYFHCSERKYGNLDKYNAAIDSRLGTPATLADYERKAQFTNYEAMRAMFEAFGANEFTSTGVIQWMYNAAWPKLWWQLYDYYLNPTGAFYGAEKACEPLHIEYDYADGGVIVVNSTSKEVYGLTLKARVYNFDMTEKYDFEKRINAPANVSEAIIALPNLDSLSTTYFLDLRLYKNGSLISVNFYALSTKPDALHPEGPPSYADLRELNHLPVVRLQLTDHYIRKGKKCFVTAVVHNPTRHLAFMVYLSVREGSSGKSLLPIFWEDNYVSLLPGETRTVHGYFYSRDLRGKSPRVAISGWNIQ